MMINDDNNMMMMCNNVNDEQVVIINDDVNNTNIVTAGPGSGKTSVLIARVIYLLNNIDINEKILLLTYSREACNQLKDRLNQKLNNDDQYLDRYKVDTYHSLSFYILKRYYKLLGYSSSPTKSNDKETIKIIDNFKNTSNGNNFNWNGQDLDGKSILKVIKTAKERYFNHSASSSSSSLSSSEETIESYFRTALENSEAYIKLYHYIQDTLKNINKIMDFQDMILEAIRLLNSEHKQLVLNDLRFNYILVDEYQDTNSRQLQLLKLMMGSKPRLTVVGDRDQLIYKFQGANEHNWIELRKHLINMNIPCKLSQLNNNFRSSDIIVQCSNIMINSNKQANHKKSVAVGRNSNILNPITIIECSTEKDQYDYITKKIEEISTSNTDRILINDIAVLYRNNAKGDSFISHISKELRGMKINHKKSIDVTNINNDKKTNVLISKLKLIINLDDNIALQNCLPSSKNDKCNEAITNIFNNCKRHNSSMFNAINIAIKQKIKHISTMKTFCNKILELQNWMDAQHEITLFEFISKVCNYSSEIISNDADDLTNEKLLEIAKNYENKQSTNLRVEVPKFVDYVEKISSEALNDEMNKPGLWVSTIHCAKGLEFRCVFLLEANKDVFQISNNGKDNELELLYVALSRAKERLFITWIGNSNNIHNGISDMLQPLLNLSSDKVQKEFYPPIKSSSVPVPQNHHQLLLSNSNQNQSKFMKSSELLKCTNAPSNISNIPEKVATANRLPVSKSNKAPVHNNLDTFFSKPNPDVTNYYFQKIESLPKKLPIEESDEVVDTGSYGKQFSQQQMKRSNQIPSQNHQQQQQLMKQLNPITSQNHLHQQMKHGQELYISTSDRKMIGKSNDDMNASCTKSRKDDNQSYIWDENSTNNSLHEDSSNIRSNDNNIINNNNSNNNAKNSSNMGIKSIEKLIVNSIDNDKRPQLQRPFTFLGKFMPISSNKRKADNMN